MPKLIDHDQRREQIAEATWRVVLAEGISSVSIRTVAAEAGISTGSLRHVFPTKTELLVHAMQLVDQRAWERIQHHLEEPDPRSLVIAVIRELLPLDAERRAEMQVNIALIAEAPGNDQIRQVRDETYAVLRDACRRMVTHIHQADLAAPELDIEAATTALHGLVDGLAVHMLVNPEPTFAQQALQAIEDNIDGLKRL
ncbi:MULTISPECIES: TetR/AcrR family transcriptional regulator [unclassified Pseudactinotalea]|uniref:TetR/AcrR family transcriptional regulator n=1 Tax=unclassified Pseudactinotalea TaxID=2649176 RepID=UPI00128D775F|nr:MULTISPECIES: TetR family transcriptional regulator C-terminal domain-containing protein [unclassified Pseudactinotalea]MPV50231.1 TetR family transcriptional regulator [Pseudactinotalea sp. HY160]QGH70177.1 TetR family transcriptional regulator [Pseudactinotalea sp. HY158]